MCFHYSLSKKAIEVATRYNRQLDIFEDSGHEEVFHINAFADPLCIVITSKKEIERFEWGLIPFWQKNE